MTNIAQVLGFEESVSIRTASQQSLSDDAALSQLHSRSHSEPLSKSLAVPTRPQKLATPPPPSRRSRAPSDPFLDTNSLSHSPSKSKHSTLRSSARNIHVDGGEGYFQPGVMSTTEEFQERRFDDQEEYGHLRVWTSPDLSNPEFMSLLSVFPAYVSRRTLPRFLATAAKHTTPDLEEGEFDDTEEMRCEVRVGSGVMWIGTRERSDRWRGNLWERLKAWWRQVLC